MSQRLIDIYSSSSKTIDALMKLELPSGVEVEIKVFDLLKKRALILSGSFF
jgi:ribosomal protein S10